MEITNCGRFGASWTYGLLTLLVASCGTDTPSIALDPTDPSAPRAVQEMQLTDSTRVRAADYGDGRASVAIRDSAGQILFGMDYQPQDDTHVLVTNRVNLGALRDGDAGVIEDSYTIERSEADKFSLDDAVMSAAILHGQYQNAAQDYFATEETTGCTIPIIGTAASCSNKGACCDQHDKCYFEYHCDYLSWDPKAPASDACKRCNDVVKTCVNPFNPSPGPAACCGPTPKENTCGEESPKWDPETPIPRFPNGITDSGLDPELSIPRSPVHSVLPGDGDAGLASSTADADRNGGARDGGVAAEDREPDDDESDCTDHAADCEAQDGPESTVLCKASDLQCPQSADDDEQDCDPSDEYCETQTSDVDPTDDGSDEVDSDEADSADADSADADSADPDSEHDTADDDATDDGSADDERPDDDSSDDCDGGCRGCGCSAQVAGDVAPQVRAARALG
jgi:hypothetical protein